MLNRNSTFINFWRFFPSTWLIEPLRLFDFGHFFLPTHYLNSTLIRDFRVNMTTCFCVNGSSKPLNHIENKELFTLLGMPWK